jgi:hypothetical protein
MLKHLINFCILLIAVSAIGYLVAPASMLSVVGAVSSNQAEFLLRTLAAALLSLIPGLWAARTSPASPTSRAVITGLVVYLILSCAVDFYGYVQSLVNTAALPSIAFRLLLGAAIAFLVQKERASGQSAPE